MKLGSFFLLSLLCLLILPTHNAVAQETNAVKKELFNPNLAIRETSNLLPVLKDTNLSGDEKRVLSREIGQKLYDRCMSKVPERFTPNAHSYYCACSSAATVGNFTRGELNTLQDAKNRVLGNKTFEKYVSEVIQPCMDVPVDEIEYLGCAVNQGNDPRILNVNAYCKCMAKGQGLHFQKYGAIDILTTWRDGKSKMFKDPVYALWESSEFQKSRNDVRAICVRNYTKKDPFKN